LDEKVVGSILELTTQHVAIADNTQTTPTKFYNLDAIIAVGYRVNHLECILTHIFEHFQEHTASYAQS
jgi:hypothetical protein